MNTIGIVLTYYLDDKHVLHAKFPIFLNSCDTIPGALQCSEMIENANLFSSNSYVSQNVFSTTMVKLRDPNTPPPRP